MKKSLFILALLYLPASYCMSQQATDPYQAKYWYYRYRLMTDFMVRGSTADCGTAPGTSIPAPQIAVTNIDKDTKEKSYTNIRWGDATSFLGFYIGVLATEYRLLANNNQPVEAVLGELRDAMLAYERLDRSEEKIYFPAKADCTVNGFFCRDDVSENLFTDHPSFNKKYDLLLNVNGLDVNTFDSDYKTLGGYPSQDQVAYLFMGFALVKKCLGDVTYQGYNFTNSAKQYTKAIITWIEGCEWKSRLPSGAPYVGYFNYGSQWGIAKAAEFICGELHAGNMRCEVKVDEDNIPYLNTDLHIDIDMRDYSPMAIAAWNDIGDVFTSPSSYFVNTVQTNNLSIPNGIGSIGEAITSIMYVKAKDYSTSLIQAYAAVGGSWQAGLVADCKTIKVPKVVGKFLSKLGIKFTEVNLCGYYLTFPGSTVPIPVALTLLPEQINPNLLTVDLTAMSLAKYGSAYDQEVYYLLHRYLHHKTGTPIIAQSIFTNILSSAPCDLPCYEPYFDPSGRLQNSEGKGGWWACNKWVDPITAFRKTKYMGLDIVGIDSKAPFYHYGIFTGLDYMLLHNLYNLTFGTVSLQNTFDKTINTPLNDNLAVLNDLTISSAITGNDINIQAGNSVILANGTTILSGNIVDIKCAPYDPNVDCSTLKSAPEPPANRYELERAAIKSEYDAEMTVKVNQLAIVADSIHQAHAYIPIDASYLNSSSLKSAKVSASNTLLSGSDKINASSGTLSDKVSVYPNPASDEINIMISLLKDDEVKVSIFDMSGRLLKVWNNAYTQGYQKIKLPLGPIGNGIYNMRVETSGYCVNQKVVIKKN